VNLQLGNILYGFFVFVIGSCFGSFFKLIVDRYRTEHSFVSRPSHCQHCKKNLEWWQNIPVVSFLLLKGKCYFCKEKFDASCLYAELTTGFICLILFITAIVRKQSMAEICLLLSFSLVLILLSMFDLKHRTIPHFISYTAIIILILASSIMNKSILSLFKALGIAFIFLDSLYFLATLIKRYRLEINSICIPLLLWTIYYFFFEYVFFIAVAITIYYLLINQKFSNKVLIPCWILVISLVSFQTYRLIFSGFEFDRLIIFYSGIGLIYFGCEIIYYFISLLFSKEEETEVKDETKEGVTIGGGDITVFALISIFLGNKGAFLTLFIASLLASVSHFTIRVAGDRLKIPKEKYSQYVPFVPFLTIACFIIIITINGK